MPSDLRRQIGAFVGFYSNQSHHESLNSVTPAGVYFRRHKVILRGREKIQKQTIHQRRLQQALWQNSDDKGFTSRIQAVRRMA